MTTFTPRPIVRCDECGAIVQEGWIFHQHEPLCSQFPADEEDCS